MRARRTLLWGAGLCGALVLCSSAAVANPRVEILRVDQARPVPGTTMTVFYRVTAGSVGDIAVSVLPANADSGTTLAIAPGESVERVAKVRPLAPGKFTIRISAGEAVGRMLDCNKIGICRGYKTRYDNFEEDLAIVDVLAADSADLLPPAIVDVSPDFPDDAATGNASPAGIIGQLVGTPDRLIAVSRTSGLWLMTNGSWRPIAGSPQYAHRIAVDPTDPYHMAVAEYLAPEVAPELSDSGLWESWDAGLTWTKVYPKVGGARINDVAFAPDTGTLLVATGDLGLLRREKTWSTNEARYQFEFVKQDPPPPADLPSSDVISISVGPRAIWVASTTRLYRSLADGKFDSQTRVPNQPFRGWTAYDLPTAAQTFSMDLRRPDATGFPEMWPATGAQVVAVTLGSLDVRNFAALDDYAYMPVKTYVPMPAPGVCTATNRPPACSDQLCDPNRPDTFNPATPTCEATGNNSTILTFDRAANAWFVRTTGDGDGSGLGGRRFMKSYVTTCTADEERVGGRWQLFHGSAQGVQQARAINARGEIQWGPIAHADEAPFHNDVWDVHIPTNRCNGAQAAAFVATDGGVFAAAPVEGGIGTSPNPDYDGNIGGMAWRSLNAGLHTHNIHDVALVASTGGKPARLAYITTDNSGWYRDAGGTWRHDRTGDAGLVGADVLGRSATMDDVAPGYIMRGLHNIKTLVDWDSDTGTFDLSDDVNLFADHDSGFQVVQSQPDDTADGKLRVVTLARVPLANKDGSTCCSDGATGMRVLFNEDFGGNARMVGDNWRALGPELPDDAKRLWPALSRSQPRLLVSAGTAGSGDARLLSWASGTTWTQVADDVLATEHVDAGAWTNAPGPAPNGPVFVKPWAPLQVFAIAGNPMGIVRLRGNALDRCNAAALTALVSHSGRFAFDGQGNSGATPARLAFMWNTELGAVGKSFQGGGYSNPSDVAFEPTDGAGWVAAATPYGDLFVAVLGGKPAQPGGRGGLPQGNGCDPLWRTLATVLPEPHAPISSIAWDGETLYVGTEGRGLLAVNNPQRAPIATYFELTSASPRRLALRRGDGAVVAFAPIHLVLRQIAADSLQSNTTTAQHFDLRADASGEFDLPAATCSGATCVGTPPVAPIAYATFAGDGSLAPAEYRWRH